MVAIKFRTDNAAFHDVNDALDMDAVAAIITDVADRIKRDYVGGNIRDTNGNIIGTFKVTNR
jgi:hypothetical protein